MRLGRLTFAAITLISLAAALMLPASASHADARSLECTGVAANGSFASLGTLEGSCRLSIAAGITRLDWDLAPARIDDLFGIPDGSVEGADQLAIWWWDAQAGLWRAWGPSLPRSLQTLTRFVPGQAYYIDARRDVEWEFATAGTSIFDRAQVVTVYGHPGVPAMGILGAGTPEDAAAEAERLAGLYDAVNGARAAVPAFHLITHVAQPHPMSDGSYLYRIPDEQLQPFVDLARERDMLLILDIQIGYADPLAEVQGLEEYFKLPFVHLALDPEFSMKHDGVAPGQAIGELHAEQANEVQRYLAGLVREHNLPRKIVILHQFEDGMLPDAEQLAHLEEIELVIDMDGFGGPGIKTRHYEWYALSDYAERPGIKLFFEQDTPLMTPQQVMDLPVPPDVVIYQ